MFFTDFTLKALENGKQVDVLFADFSKVFDRIPHDKLIGKLSSFSFDLSTITCISSYLTQRKRFFRIDTYDSAIFDVSSGVPKGSHIGPALLFIYVNDILDVSRDTNHLLFADDTKIFAIVNRDAWDAPNFQASINDLSNWSPNNELVLNISKCKIMSFSRKHHPLLANYNINGMAVEHVTSFIDLDITLDEKMTFNLHYDAIIEK